jgi:hypothetical protein
MVLTMAQQRSLASKEQENRERKKKIRKVCKTHPRTSVKQFNKKRRKARNVIGVIDLFADF